MIVEEKHLSRLQLATLRTLYRFLQESDSQAKIANSDDTEKIENLLDDLGEHFPFLKPLRKFRVTVTQDWVVMAHSEEGCEDLVAEVSWEPHHEKLVDAEFCDFTVFDA